MVGRLAVESTDCPGSPLGYARNGRLASRNRLWERTEIVRGSSLRRTDFAAHSLRNAKLPFIQDRFGFRIQRIRTRETYRNAIEVQLRFSAAVFADCHKVILSRVRPI
jgi:hypothetical protein